MPSVEISPEIKGQEARSFILTVTQREVGVTSGRSRTHPVFPYHIRAGESYPIGNLQILAGVPCVETQSVELTLQDSHVEDNGICLDELRLEGDVLLLGTKGAAALREIKGEIIMLQMSLSRDIKLDMTIPKNEALISD